jgi:hypothetical protein
MKEETRCHGTGNGYKVTSCNLGRRSFGGKKRFVIRDLDSVGEDMFSLISIGIGRPCSDLLWD